MLRATCWSLNTKKNRWWKKPQFPFGNCGFFISLPMRFGAFRKNPMPLIVLQKNIFSNPLAFCAKWWYNDYGKQTKYTVNGCIFFLGYLYPFLAILSLLNLIKCKFRIERVLYTQSIFSLFGDGWNLRFCALISVGALFLFFKEVQLCTDAPNATRH